MVTAYIRFLLDRLWTPDTNIEHLPYRRSDMKLKNCLPSGESVQPADTKPSELSRIRAANGRGASSRPREFKSNTTGSVIARRFRSSLRLWAGNLAGSAKSLRTSR